MKAKDNIIFMQVTNDKYEFPVVVADTLAELSAKTNAPSTSISSQISRAKRLGTTCIYKKIVLEDEENEGKN